MGGVGGFFKKAGKTAFNIGTLGQGGKVLEGMGLKEGAAERSAAQALGLYEGIQSPELQKLALQRFQSAGDPRNFVTQQQASNLGGIQVDPAGRNAQIQALNKIGGIVSGGGFDATERAQIEQMNRLQGLRERAGRESILQNARTRGVAGSGLEFAQQIANQQQSADTARMQGTEIAGMGQQRLLQALQSQANIGGQFSQQDFGQQAEKARAQDIINQFNAQMLSNAGQSAFQNMQGLANQNVGLANQERVYNTQDLPMTRFKNTMDLTNARANALNRLANAQETRTGRITQVAGAALGAAARGGA